MPVPRKRAAVAELTRAGAARRRSSRSCWRCSPSAIAWSCCPICSPPTASACSITATSSAPKSRPRRRSTAERAQAIEQQPGARSPAAPCTLATRVDPVDHRRHGRAHRQHGLRRQRHAAAGEDEAAAEASSGWLRTERQDRTWTSKLKRSPRSSASRSAATPSTSTSPKSAASSRSATASRACTASSNAMAGEMLEFPHGVFGIALNLEEESVGAVLLGEFKEIKEGDLGQAHRPHHLGAGRRRDARPRRQRARPADRRQGPDRARSSSSPIERIAPGVVDRQPVKEPLQTGLKAIDAMVPIGRGQRELIIGDRQTGKTAVAIDAILNQKDTGVICIYNAIGQKQSTVAQVVRTLEEADAMRYTIVVAADGVRSGAAALHQPVFGVHDRRVLPRQRPPRAGRLRRSVEARAGVSRDLAAAAPAAGPRGVSRATSSICTRVCWSARRS